ncbi:MAG: hypothetical protein ACLQVL_26750 [Terriglobia bacterium]
MPTLCVIFGALSAQRLVPQVPYSILAALIAGTITFLNLRGIRSVARANQVTLAFIALVFLAFIVLALQYFFQHERWAGILSWRPFYNPQTFNLRAWAGNRFFWRWPSCSFLLSYQVTAELLNFGAFLGFMGVNLATIQQFFVLSKGGRKRRLLADGVVPALGFLFCFAFWLGLERPAKLVGGTWFLAGLVYDGIRTRGFRLRPAMLEIDDT